MTPHARDGRRPGILLAAAVAVASVVGARAQAPAIRHFALGAFHFESGTTIPDAQIAYVTYGTLDAAKDNAILLVSAYGGIATSYGYLIGPNRALDPARDFIVSTEMFGSSGSSSPSNTPAPFDGPRFPRIAIRDDVEGSRQVLHGLGVTHLKAVIGFSMGAQQAFQWAVAHPDEVDAIVALCGTAKTYPHGWIRLQSAIDALRADPRWKNGDYTDLPADGIRAWAEHWGSWMYSQEWWRQELYKSRGVTSMDDFIAAQIRRWSGTNLNDDVALAHAWQDHDVSKSPGQHGDIEATLRSIRPPVLYMPSTSDMYFPVTDATYEKAFLSRVQFSPIPSIWGHTAGGGASAADSAFINHAVAAFLADPPKTP